jgi:hypothetical protein
MPITLCGLLLTNQDAVFEVALELTRLKRRLAQVSASLPLPVDVDDVFEGRVVSTPATQLYGASVGAQETLKEMIVMLLEAVQVDEVALRERFRKWQEQAS